MEDKHIVSFSGGKDSTAMLLMMIEKNMQIDEIIFCDTGIEYPELYDHIKAVEKYINRPITKIKSKISFETYALTYERVTKTGEVKKGMGWPHPIRWCTSALKRDVFYTYLTQYTKHYNIIDYHGIAFDEQARVNKNIRHTIKREIRHPLIDWEITEKEAYDYCINNGFTWNNLYTKIKKINCFLCPKMRISDLKYLYTERKDLWEYMLYIDKNQNSCYRHNFTLSELDERFTKTIELSKKYYGRDIKDRSEFRDILKSDNIVLPENISSPIQKDTLKNIKAKKTTL
jgi:3'-phosphoadenosine 5'-phosphosulfate sulfotransferase (PAPS reductase)/FAD synthetase